jgi:hypothetical protein
MRTYTDTPDPKDRWGKVASSLDDAKDLRAFEQRLRAFGFPDYEELVSRVGKIRLYAYQGQKLFSYGYCCVIYVGTSGIPIFLKDLPDVFRLMAEIGAHSPQETNLAEHLEEVKSELWEIKNGLLEAVGLMRKHPTTQDLKEVQQPLLEITTLLKGLKTSLLMKVATVLPSEEKHTQPKNGK